MLLNSIVTFKIGSEAKWGALPRSTLHMIFCDEKKKQQKNISTSVCVMGVSISQCVCEWQNSF